MGTISSDQHNMTRRATKSKRKSTAKRGSGDVNIEQDSILTLAIAERRKAAWIEQKKLENQQRLMEMLQQKKMLIFESTPFDDDTVMIQFRRDCRDIKMAIKALPRDQRRDFRWEESYDEVRYVSYFRVAIIIRK